MVTEKQILGNIQLFAPSFFYLSNTISQFNNKLRNLWFHDTYVACVFCSGPILSHNVSVLIFVNHKSEFILYLFFVKLFSIEK